MKINIKVEELTHDDIVNILSTALYGSPYLVVDNTVKEYEEATGDTIEDRLADMLLKGQKVVLIDAEEDKKHNLTLSKLKKGWGQYIAKGGSTDIEDYDLLDADAIIQYSIFGDVIYG